jgi:hypothetical protein
MSDSPRYPGPPWRPFLALALTGASFCYFTSVWKRHTLPLQAAYLNDYLRVSVGAADLPVKYTLVYAGNRLALPTDAGTLVKREGKVNAPAFTRYLQQDIYEGKTVWNVLLWPLIGSSLVLLLSMSLAFMFGRNESDEARNGRLLRGPRLISQWRFNLPMLFNKKNRGFHIESK